MYYTENNKSVKKGWIYSQIHVLYTELHFILGAQLDSHTYIVALKYLKLYTDKITTYWYFVQVITIKSDVKLHVY